MKLSLASAFLTSTLCSLPAFAQFAEPPDGQPLEVDRPSYHRAPEPTPAPGSTLRVSLGPALLVQPATPGLLAALDIGRGAVGARFSGAWLNAGEEGGLATYGGELWIDFGAGRELHPIIGAGAAMLDGDLTGQQDSSGAGTLRGAIEYQLPVRDAEARVGMSLTALVPAINSQREEPWVIGALTVSAGF